MYALAADHPHRVDRVALAEIPGSPVVASSPPCSSPSRSEALAVERNGASTILTQKPRASCRRPRARRRLRISSRTRPTSDRSGVRRIPDRSPRGRCLTRCTKRRVQVTPTIRPGPLGPVAQGPDPSALRLRPGPLPWPWPHVAPWPARGRRRFSRGCAVPVERARLVRLRGDVTDVRT